MMMFNKVMELYKNGTADDLPYFLLGCIATLALWILLMLLRYFLMFLFREHRCKYLMIKSPSGDVSISAKAIFEVINALKVEFKFIDIEKITMSEVGCKYNFNINLTVNLASQQLPTFVESYKRRISEILRVNFGIKNVRCIRLNVKNIQLDYAELDNGISAFPANTNSVDNKIDDDSVNKITDNNNFSDSETLIDTNFDEDEK